MPGASKNIICFKQILLQPVLEICCLSLHASSHAPIKLMLKCPRVASFNLDTRNMFGWFKVFLLIYIFLDLSVNTEFLLHAQLTLKVSGISHSSLAGLDCHEFIYDFCRISPSLQLEDTEVTFVLLNALLIHLACFLSLSVFNPWVFCPSDKCLHYMVRLLLQSQLSGEKPHWITHGVIKFLLILGEWEKEASLCTHVTLPDSSDNCLLLLSHMYCCI